METCGFEQTKRNILSNLLAGIDNSPKGTIDIPIRDLVHLVNSLPSYVTTSSCSGRISCYYSSASKGIEWIYVKHRTITCDEMELLLGEGGVEVLPEKLLMLKCEPAILHILCSDLNAAHNLHQVAYSCGYRESGIGIGKKIIVAIRTTAFSLEVPISQGGNLLITNDGLKVLVQECNSRLIRNFDRIQRLLNVLKTTHNWPTLSLPLNTQRQKIRTYQIVTELHQSDIILPMCSTLENFISSLEIQHYALLNWKTNIFPALADFFLFSGGRKSLEIQLPCIWCVVIKSPNSPCNLTFAQTGDIPSNRWGHSLCKFDSRRMLLVGGRNRQTVFDDAYLLEICDSGSESVILFHWTQIASYPCPIFYHAASFLGDTRGCLISGGLCKFQLQNPDIQLTEMFSYRLTSTSRFAATHLKNKFSEELDEATEVIFHTLSWIRVDFPLTSTYRFGHTMTLIGAQTLIIIGGDSFYPFRCDGKSGEIELWDLHFSDSPSLQISLRSSCKSSKYELAFGERSYHQTVLLDDHILVFGGSLHCEALLGSLLNAPPIELTYFDHRFSHERFLSSCKTFPDPAMLIPTHLTKQLKNFLETFSCYNKARRIVSPAIADLSPIFQIELCGECVSFNDVNHLTNLSRLEKWKAIPFTHQFWDLLTENISFRHDLAASLAGEFPDNIALYVVNINNSPQSKISSTSGSKKAVLYLQGLIPEILKQVSISKPDDLPKIENELHCDIPAKFEFVGDIIMIPECSLLMAEWELHLCFSMIFQKLLDIFNESGKNDSTKLKYTRIARKAQIDPGPMRESRVRILHPNESNTSGWVELIENKILYGFDITKVMFCSGNVTERMRMAKFVNTKVSEEIIVDLYAGIGYYTLPFLLGAASAKSVFSCEWNPNSIAALEYNLQKAGINPLLIDVTKDAISHQIFQRRCVIFKGDNRISAGSHAVSHIADRVCLGLLPSSVDGWPLAVNVLKLDGGILHVHENVHDKEIGAWVENCCATFKDLFEVSDRKEGRKLGSMTVSCTHIERVKSFSPHVIHIVADLLCTRIPI